jgi:hypothetical protein
MHDEMILWYVTLLLLVVVVAMRSSFGLKKVEILVFGRGRDHHTITYTLVSRIQYTI